MNRLREQFNIINKIYTNKTNKKRDFIGLNITKVLPYDTFNKMISTNIYTKKEIILDKKSDPDIFLKPIFQVIDDKTLKNSIDDIISRGFICNFVYNIPFIGNKLCGINGLLYIIIGIVIISVFIIYFIFKK